MEIQNDQGEKEKRYYRQNGLFATNERLPVKTGGLGEVCYTITQAMSKFGNPSDNGYDSKYGNAPRDMRVVVPYLQTNRLQDDEFKDLLKKVPEKAAELKRLQSSFWLSNEQKETLKGLQADKQKLATLQKDYGQPFQPTNVTVTAKTKGKAYDFQVMQAFEPAFDKNGKAMVDAKTGRKMGSWIYALKNDALFSNTGNIATYDSMSKASLELLTPFNEAVGKLVPYLEGQSKAQRPIKDGEQALSTFPNGRLDFVVGNDWLTGSTIYQDGIRERDDIHKIFYMHNNYDSGAVKAEEAGYDRKWPLPSILTNPKELYSHLTLSLKSADAVVANRNFVKTLTKTDFGKGQPYVAPLKAHLERGTIFDMHHGLAEDFRPDDNEFLKANNDNEYRGSKEKKQLDAMLALTKDREPYQFRELNKAALAPNTSAERKERLWNEFKSANKKAVQLKYGLTVNPNAVVMSWAARLEPNQKGFYLVQNTMVKLLKENPNLQILVAGNVGNPATYDVNQRKLHEWIDEVSKKYPGQLYMPNAFINKREITQLNAGSTFTILPSLYEPYGLTQLEAIMMGSIPLVNGVDGLRTTVSDPKIRNKKNFDFIGTEGEGKEKVWDYGQTGVMMHDINVPKYREAIMRGQFFEILKDQVRNNPDEVYQWSSKTEDAFQKLHEELTEAQGRFANEPEKQKAIAALATRMGKAKSTTALKEGDLKLLQAIQDKDRVDYLNHAEKQFADAMQDAINMAGKKQAVVDPKTGKTVERDLIATVRANGLKFMLENHNWQEIIKSRYYPLLDAVIKPENRGQVFQMNQTPPFPRTKGGRKSGNKSEDVGTLGKTWANFKAALATMVYYLNILNWFKKPGTQPVDPEKAAPAAA